MPLKRPTTTPVPDEIFDEWLAVLGDAELRVLLYIVRRTFGFDKRSGDTISYTQFTDGITARDGRILDRGCGVRNRTNVAKALRALEGRGIIRRVQRHAPEGDAAVTFYVLWFEGAPPATTTRAIVPLCPPSNPHAERDASRPKGVVLLRHYQVLPQHYLVPLRHHPGPRRHHGVVPPQHDG